MCSSTLCVSRNHELSLFGSLTHVALLCCVCQPSKDLVWPQLWFMDKFWSFGGEGGNCFIVPAAWALSSSSGEVPWLTPLWGWCWRRQLVVCRWVGDQLSQTLGGLSCSWRMLDEAVPIQSGTFCSQGAESVLTAGGIAWQLSWL